MTDDVFETRLAAAFEAGDPGAWGDLASIPTRLVLEAALERIAGGDYDSVLARSGFLAIPASAAPTLAEIFERERPGADFVALALAASRHEAAVPILASLLGDPELSTIAVAGLSRQRAAAFGAVEHELRKGKKAVRLDAIRIFEAWEADEAWKTAILEQFERERTADVRRALEPLVEDALGKVSTRTIDALARSLSVEETEQIASMLEQALYMGGRDFLPPELLERVDRAVVAAHQHLGILSDARHGVVETWWEIIDLLEFTPVARWLSAALAVDPGRLDDDAWNHHLERLATSGPEAVTDVARLYGSRRLTESRRARLVDWLAAHVTDDDIDVIARRLRSPDSDERDDAENALCAFGPPGGIAALEHLDAALAASRSAAARVLVANPSRPVARQVAVRLADERATEPKALLVEAWFATEDLHLLRNLAPETDLESKTEAVEKAADRLADLDLDPELLEHHRLPPLHWSSGERVSDSVRSWLVARCRTQAERGTDPVLARIASRLDPLARRHFHHALLGDEPVHTETWKAHTWVALGDRDHHLACRRWMESEDGRATSLAEARVSALAAIGDLGVMILLAWYNDGAWAPDRRRARSELERLAERHGTQLADFIAAHVPRFDLDARGRHPWGLGSRTGLGLEWRASTLTVLNEEGEPLQSVPNPRKGEDEDRVSYDLARLRSLRDAAGFVERTLREHLKSSMLDSIEVAAAVIESWSGHPIVHPIATRILWGVHRPTQPPTPLRFDESGAWANIDDEPVALTATDRVRPIHPADMSRDDRRDWMSLFGDYEIVQPFAQLARPVFRPRQNELSMTTFLRFGGRHVEATRLRWLVWGSDGWRLGPSETMWNRYVERPFRRWGLTAVLRWDPGFSVRGDDDDPTQVLQAAYVVRGCDLTELDLAERITLIDAPPAVFSEIVYMIARAFDALDDQSFE